MPAGHTAAACPTSTGSVAATALSQSCTASGSPSAHRMFCASKSPWPTIVSAPANLESRSRTAIATSSSHGAACTALRSSSRSSAAGHSPGSAMIPGHPRRRRRQLPHPADRRRQPHQLRQKTGVPIRRVGALCRDFSLGYQDLRARREAAQRMRPSKRLGTRKPGLEQVALHGRARRQPRRGGTHLHHHRPAILQPHPAHSGQVLHSEQNLGRPAPKMAPAPDRQLALVNLHCRHARQC